MSVPGFVIVSDDETGDNSTIHTAVTDKSGIQKLVTLSEVSSLQDDLPTGEETAEDGAIRVLRDGERLHYHCSHCVKNFLSLKSLTRHKKKAHPEAPDDDESAELGDNSDQQKMARKQPARPSIVVQDEHLATQVAMEIHHLQTKKKRKRPIYKSNKEHQCGTCWKTFATPSFLRRHMVVHTGEKPYPCPFCDKRYTQAEHLRRHKGTHTGENVFTCSVCQKTFLEKTRYTDHMLSHLDERPYECNICHKGFTDRVGLQKHNKIHIGERKFECDVCQKRFIERQSLKIHQRIHTGEHPHKCKFCEKGFNREKLLEIHMYRHYGDRRFQCAVCLKKFASMKSLGSHSIKEHSKNAVNSPQPEPVEELAEERKITPSEGTPFHQCKICSRRFERKCSLTVHTKAMHGNMTPDILTVKCGVCGMTFPTLNDAREHVKIHEDSEEDWSNQSADQDIEQGAFQSASLGNVQGQEGVEGTRVGQSPSLQAVEQTVTIQSMPRTANVHDQSGLDAMSSVPTSMTGVGHSYQEDAQAGQRFNQGYDVSGVDGYYVANHHQSNIDMPTSEEHERLQGQRVEIIQSGTSAAYNAAIGPTGPNSEAVNAEYQQQGNGMEILSTQAINHQTGFSRDNLAVDSIGQIEYNKDGEMYTRYTGGPYVLQVDYRDGDETNPPAVGQMIGQNQHAFNADNSALVPEHAQTPAVSVDNLGYAVESRPGGNWMHSGQQDGGQPPEVSEHQTIQTSNWMADLNALQQMETNEIAAAMTSLAQWPPTDYQVPRNEILLGVVSDNGEGALESRTESLDTSTKSDGIKGLIKKSIESEQKETGSAVPDRSRSFAPTKLLAEYMPKKRKRRRSI